jgi:hypothetical protein
MNGSSVEHNTNSFTTNREQVILSLLNSFLPILHSIDEPTIDDNDGKLNALYRSKETDESVINFLDFVSAKFLLWIFDWYANSENLQTQLWTHFFYPTIRKYRSNFVSKSATVSDTKQDVVKLSQNRKRFEKISKHIGHFYRDFIARSIEKFGITPQLTYVATILHLRLNTCIGSISPSNEKFTFILHWSAHNALCHLGDLARYRSQALSKGTFEHAFTYYTAAFNIQPSSGVPLNQLGNIAYSKEDIFSGVYYFVRSLSVDKPFPNGNDNLRIVLKKLMRIKDNTLDQTYIEGVLDTKVKVTLMRLLQLYSTFYVPSKSTKSPELAQIIQEELTDELFELAKEGTVSEESFVKLGIISVSFPWLLEQRDGTNSASSDTGLGLTLKIFEKILSATLYVFATKSEEDEAFKRLLPVLRIYFDWLHKLPVMSLQEQNIFTVIFKKTVLVLEHLRNNHGFKFDIVTAVGRSNWDKFDEFARKNNAPISDSDIDSDDDKSTKSHSYNTEKIYEETQSLGLLAINGGLDDIPTGLEEQNNNTDYRVQCLLFSGIELGRLGLCVEINEFAGDLAEFKYVESMIPDKELVALMSASNFAADHANALSKAQNGSSFLHFAPPAYPTANDEASHDGSLKRESTTSAHQQQVPQQSNIKLSEKNMEERQALFMRRPGSTAQLVNASASPKFLKKLRALEYKGTAQNGINPNGGRSKKNIKSKTSGHITQPAGSHLNNASGNGDNGKNKEGDALKKSSRRRQTRKDNDPPATRPFVSDDSAAAAVFSPVLGRLDNNGYASEDDEDDEEEIVFLGRRAAAT